MVQIINSHPKQKGGLKMTTKTGYISGRCNGCQKVGPYNKMRAWSLKDIGLMPSRNLKEFAFCSKDCAQTFEDKLWFEKLYGMGAE